MRRQSLSTGGQSELGWVKTSLTTGNGCCVMVKLLEGGEIVLIRDSKYGRNLDNDPAAEPVIAVTAPQWQRFLSQVKGSSFEPLTTTLVVTEHADGSVALTSTVDATTLTYTPAEWEAFVGGVADGELTTDHLLAAV